MASNQLSGRPFFPRPPVVCVEGPIDPGFNLTCLIWVSALQLPTYGLATVYWFGSNTLRVKGEPVASVWTIDHGHFRRKPITDNRIESYGSITAPAYECTMRITVMSTWQDGTKMFAFVEIPVYEPMP